MFVAFPRLCSLFAPLFPLASSRRRTTAWAATFALCALLATGLHAQPPDAAWTKHYLYVAEPGIRNYLQYGGHGVVVFDIDNDYRFAKRIPFQGLAKDGTPDNVKGICGSAHTSLLHVSTQAKLICIDLRTDKVLWERSYPFGCDRMSISPDGKVIYLPSLEQDVWYVLDAATGDERQRIEPKSGSHNTVFGPDGRFVYLAGLRSNLLTVVDAQAHTVAKRVGPFSQAIRPFTVNGSQTWCFNNVNELLGFEIGDLKSDQLLYRVEVPGFATGPVKRHGCPSHGIALTPDEREVWVADAHNSQLHLFDATVMPPRYVASIAVREQPGWITFSIDGKTCWSSTGDVIDTASRKIVARLTDEEGRMVMSEKLLEVDFEGERVAAVGDQFGRGYQAVPPVQQAGEAGEDSLFNGVDLAGWVVENGGKFSVRNGLLFVDRGTGWLRSAREFGDALFQLEFRFLEKEANSGIFVRTGITSHDDQNGWPDNGYQVQCMDTLTGKIPLATMIPYGAPDFQHESDLQKLAQVFRATGEWNSYEIRTVGEELTVKLNGEVITKASPIKRRRGHFGIQAELGQVEFRNLRVKAL